ncbi:MAG TPA: hypothetical protein VG435_18420 [Acidimicrobiales bacterium]|nr:hypothetical protein [Acidimicrobiales bacterium]
MTTSVPEALDDLAADLQERHGPSVARAGRPSWLQLEWIQGAWRSAPVLDDRGLFGCRVPARFGAVAVVATGRLRAIDDAHEPPAELRSGFAGGLTLACVVDRAGSVGSHIRLPDGGLIGTHPQAGMMMDTLRRSLGLPTAPPPESVVRVHLLHWMEAIIDAPAGHRLGWEAVLAAYPWISHFSFADADEAELMIQAMIWVHGWSSLRTRVAAGVDECEDLSPADADWMDDGMFARWILDFTPPIDPLVARAVRVATPAAGHRLRAFVRELIDEAEAAQTA